MAETKRLLAETAASSAHSAHPQVHQSVFAFCQKCSKNIQNKQTCQNIYLLDLHIFSQLILKLKVLSFKQLTSMEDQREQIEIN